MILKAISRYIASVPALSPFAISHKDFEVLRDILTVLNVAHRTQELLSFDKTPTLAYAFPLYHGLIKQWKKLRAAMPALSYSIGAGVTKIEEYLDKAKSSPAYVLAMALNPSIRYSWIEQNWSLDDAKKAKELVKKHVSYCVRSIDVFI